MNVTEIQNDGALGRVIDLQRELSRPGTALELVHRFLLRARGLMGFDYFANIVVDPAEAPRYRLMQRGELRNDLTVEEVAAACYWKRDEPAPVGEGGFIGAVALDERVRVIDGLDVPDDPVLGASLAAMRSCVVVPIFKAGVVNEWVLLFKREDVPPSDEALARLVQASNLLGQVIDQRALIEEIHGLNGTLRRQIDEISRVQRSILPASPLRAEGLSMAVSYEPCDAAGGDYYDYMAYPDGRYGIMIADVSGHGPAASVVMAMMRTVMGAYRAFGRAQQSVVEDVNLTLYDALREGTFVTAFFFLIDPATGRGSYANCGHNLPRLRRADGRVESFGDCRSIPLGIIPDIETEGDEFTIEPGDSVVLYTDGIVEAFDRRDRMFGLSRLDDAISSADGSPNATLDSILGAVARHAGGRARDDDQCVVVVRYE